MRAPGRRIPRRPATAALAAVVTVMMGGLALSSCSDSDSDADRDTGNEEGRATTTDTQDGTSTTTVVPLPDPVLEDRRCPANLDVADAVVAECHWLVVPERRDAFDGDTLRLAVTVLHTPSPDPRPDPVVYLSGGPGFPGGTPRYWSTTPFVAERDVIVWDQRGTGASEPDLECPEMEEAVFEVFGDARPYEEERDLALEAIAACRDRLVAEGVDLAAFSTPVNAADLADLRLALGYDEWNLLGVSYGSRLAQEAARSHPEGIRSVILDSTYPTDEASATELVDGAQRALDQLAAGCAADPECAAVHGDLTTGLEEIVARFNTEPYRTSYDFGDDGGVRPMVITGDDIVAGLFTAMYDTELIPVLPAFATALASGQTGLIDQVAGQGIPFINDVAEGMALSTSCADAAPVAEETAATDAGLLADPGRWSTMLTVFSPAFCESWPAGSAGADFPEPVSTEIPTLVLSGTYDPVTPTPGAEQVAEALPNSLLVVFEGIGHGVWNANPCATTITEAFLEDPGTWPDTSCQETVGAPDFA